MFWLLYLALPVYAGASAASHIGPKHGFLAGLATLVAVMIAVLVPQTALLFWLSGIRERKNRTVPTQSDAPAAANPPRIKLPDQIGAQARFRQLIVYDDENGRQDATRLIYSLLEKQIAEHVDVEAGGEGSAASMVSASEMAGLEVPPPRPDEVLVVLRSHDNAWSGFRCGGDSFRFQCRAITEIAATLIHPAKGPGGCDFAIRFATSRKASVSGIDGQPSIYDRSGYISAFDLPFSTDERHARALVSAFAEVAHMLDAKYEISECMDV
ncbi:hypothetical protein [Ralstonia flaminis]|jgi:hypothetical protein|uniref:Transmembrane protein n=1 Tax=Ralstonia flaminis TaxID=3058597 RepID=A0ABN9JQ84_9RALS|nr:hypothetical protein [Ralstonia sp. LMG 18101]CAJ0820868.1 hypothetical protein LMG18101_04432 [Ralstonia sp. LMG 18101]